MPASDRLRFFYLHTIMDGSLDRLGKNTKDHVLNLVAKYSIQEALRTKGKNKGAFNALSLTSKSLRNTIMQHGLSRQLSKKEATDRLLRAIGDTRTPMMLLTRSIAAGGNVNHRNKDLRTPLMKAIKRDDVVNALISAGANVNARDRLYETPLIKASRLGYASIVRKLLDANANVNIQTRNGQTALMVAAEQGYTNIVRLLLSRGANPYMVDAYKKHALVYAVYHRHPEIISELVNAMDLCRTRYGVQPLFVALSQGSVDIVRLLLSKGTKPNARFPKTGDTPLMTAARERQPEVMRVLIEGGANVHMKNYKGMTALKFAIDSGEMNGVRVLLDHGAKANGSGLMYAIWYAPAQITRALLEHGVNANFKDATGDTPLFLALRMRRDKPTLRVLLEHGAKMNAINTSRVPQGMMASLKRCATNLQR